MSAGRLRISPLYAVGQSTYLECMTTITSRQEQRHTASAARRVGGYSELVRLESERLQRGGGGSVAQNPQTGRFVIVKRRRPTTTLISE